MAMYSYLSDVYIVLQLALLGILFWIFGVILWFGI